MVTAIDIGTAVVVEAVLVDYVVHVAFNIDFVINSVVTVYVVAIPAFVSVVNVVIADVAIVFIFVGILSYQS